MGIDARDQNMDNWANMETITLSIASRREIVGANFVHRTPTNWPVNGEFKPRAHFLYYAREGIRHMDDWEEQFAMDPGDVILFYARRVYGSRRPPAPYRAMNILFNPLAGDTCRKGALTETMQSKRDEITIHSRIRTGGDPAIRERFEEVVHLANSPMPLRCRKSEVLLEDLLIELALRSRPLSDQQAAPVEYAVGYIEKHLNEKISIDFLADLVGMSRRSLTRHFREATGRSIQAYQLDRKLALTASIIKTHPDITLKEVAHTMGFYDEFHLSRAFRKRYGSSPAAYRRR